MNTERRLILALCIISISSISLATDDAFEDTHFSGSGACANCHDGITDESGNDVSIGQDWSTSMMANASRDPYWMAKVASELHRNSALADVINDTCSRCHAPMAHESARKEGDTIKLFEDGFLNSGNSYHNHAMDGVSCTVCHQIKDSTSLGMLAGFSGNFLIDEFAIPSNRPAFGPYPGPLTNPMRNQSLFNPVFSTHIQESSLCATCHNLKTPFVDADGNAASSTPESEFPEQMVFTEWQNSDYRMGGAQQQSCQGCHMPTVDSLVRISNRPPPANLSPRSDFSRHSFLGANTVMMDILNQNAATLGITATGFESSIERTRAFLQTAASIEIISADILDDKLQFTLKVLNHTGHKLPTSYPSRRAYLHFLVHNQDGQLIFESGKTNPDGSIVGVNGDDDPSTYEPHYQLISSKDQVQVYEPIMQNTDSEITHTLLRAASYRKDNRLTPAGFNKNSVPADVAVKGAALSDVDFNMGSDTLTYSVALGGQGNIKVDVSLKYQSLSYGHLQDMFNEASEVDEVADFQSLFQGAGIRSETLASVSWSNLVDTPVQFFVLPGKDGRAVVIPL